MTDMKCHPRSHGLGGSDPDHKKRFKRSSGVTKLTPDVTRKHANGDSCYQPGRFHF